MGYMTTYTITAFTDDGPLKAGTIHNHLDAQRVDVYDDFGNEDSIGFWAKWYDCENDMIAVSKANPDVTYRIYGSGEEAGDEWVCFYKNGQMEHHDRPLWVEPKVPERI